MNKGFVYLVGAGPGDADLITKAGYELIQKCEVLIYDRLISSKLIELTNDNCKKIYVGKTVGNHAIKQEEISKIIVEEALRDKLVVRLKGGDPFVFGRGGEEILELQKHKIPYKVIPGVTSAISGLAYAGVPITHRGKSRGFHVVTGHSNDDNSSIPDNLDILAKLNETLVFLMGFGNLEKIVEGLIQNGKNVNTPVAIISNATTEKQIEVRGNLGNIVEVVKKSSVKAPALIVVGEVADLDFRDSNNILSGVNVGVTGTTDLVAKQKALLEFYGANVYEVCTFNVVDIKNEEFDNALKSIKQYSWIVFTSANSVKMFFTRLYNLKIDLRQLGSIKFAVVGSGTEEVLNTFGFNADFKPTKFSSKHLGNELIKVLTKDENSKENSNEESNDNSNEKLLIPYAKNHTNELTNILANNKINFNEHIIYDIELKELSDFDLSKLDYLTFSSTKSVIEFFEKKNTKLSQDCKVVCIGDLTKIELEKYVKNATKTPVADVTGLINTIVELRGAL